MKLILLRWLCQVLYHSKRWKIEGNLPGNADYLKVVTLLNFFVNKWVCWQQSPMFLLWKDWQKGKMNCVMKELKEMVATYQRSEALDTFCHNIIPFTWSIFTRKIKTAQWIVCEQLAQNCKVLSVAPTALSASPPKSAPSSLLPPLTHLAPCTPSGLSEDAFSSSMTGLSLAPELTTAPSSTSPEYIL